MSATFKGQVWRRIGRQLMRTRTAWLGLIVPLLMSGCGPTVTPLSLHDTRLPPEARRWVADAEDAVVVADARRSDAVAEAASTRAWRRRLASRLPLPGAGADAGAKLEILLDKRVRAAADAAALTEAELALTQARLEQAYAETAMRYDLDVYALKPIRAATEGAQTEVAERKAAASAARQAAFAAGSAWWDAYRAFVAGGGDASALWVAR